MPPPELPPSHIRDHIERLIFGESSRRFTQDSPVLPDVWIGYAEALNRPLDLLITPFREIRPGTLAEILRRRLEAERKTASWKSRPRPHGTAARVAYNQSTVAACLYFDEVVRVVLPLTGWWDDRVERLTDGDIVGALDALIGHPDLERLFEDPWSPPRRPEFDPEVIGMIRIVGSIAYSDRENVADLARKDPGALWDTIGQDPRGVVAETMALMSGLVPEEVSDSLIFTVSQNRRATSALTRSVAAVKGDAACRLFDIRCDRLTWAVIDSGVDATHPAFRMRRVEVGADGRSRERPYPEAFEREGARWKNRTRIRATYDFTRIRHLLSADVLAGQQLPADFPEPLRQRLEEHPEMVKDLKRSLKGGRLLDWSLLEPLLEVPHTDAYSAEHVPRHEHGTHVAGILAADWRKDDDIPPGADDVVGVCRDIHLYDLRVLDERGVGDEFAVIAALQFVRHLNAHKEYIVVHGANLSLSIRHDVANYACGRTPVCDEAERLVGAGVIVVAAAGNQGYLQYMTAKGPEEGYRSISITDPGNAEGVITVGATHRHQPHTYGVSYFSSRGPTGDGRIKPDLVAPGEKIEAPVPNTGLRRMDGTSMAAPHVSGVAALLIARHRELAGQPARVRRALCETATDLGRERYFQGHGMVDALRALQSI